MVNPTAEQGINVVTRRVVANATAAVVAMARVPEVPAGSRPLCAITSYGSTTPTVARCAAFMERRGWDAAVFHAVGVPGATMEDLVRSGHDHRGHRPHDRRADEHPVGQRLRHARGLGGRAPHRGRRDRGSPRSSPPAASTRRRSGPSRRCRSATSTTSRAGDARGGGTPASPISTTRA